MKSIVLVNKDDLTRLIKKSVIYIHSSDISSFDDDIQNAESIFSSTEPFEFPIEKTFIRVKCDRVTNYIEINNVTSILPIDQTGYQNFSTQFSYWKIENPQNKIEELFYSICQKRLVSQKTRMGINLFREICNLHQIEDNDNIARLVKKGTEYRQKIKYYNLPYSEREAWSFLIAYDRYEPYPQGNIGFFCDIIEMIVYLKKDNLIGYRDNLIKENAPTKIIMELPHDTKWPTVIKQLEKNDKGKHFIKMADDYWGSIYAPLIYLYLKELIGKQGLTNDTWKIIFQIKQSYPKEFDCAATAIGGFFNYDNIKDEYLKMIRTNVKPIDLFDSTKKDYQQKETRTKELELQKESETTSEKENNYPKIRKEDWIEVFGLVLSGEKLKKRYDTLIQAIESEDFLQNISCEYYKNNKLIWLVLNKYCTEKQADKIQQKMKQHNNNINLFNQ